MEPAPWHSKMDKGEARAQDLIQDSGIYVAEGLGVDGRPGSPMS